MKFSTANFLNGHRIINLRLFVKDRPGHDHRYAIDFSKIKNELEWAPSFSFEEEWKRQLTGISAIKNGVKMLLPVNIKGEIRFIMTIEKE